MLKVLHIIYDDPANPWVGGGGSVRVRELYNRLHGRVSATVATGNYPGAENETIGGISYVRLGATQPYAWSRLTYAFKANALLRHAQYDAAVFDFSGYTPIFLPRGRPTGVTIHHLSSPTGAKRWGRPLTRALLALEKTMIRRASRISATSDSARDAAGQIAPRTPVHMVAAGVPSELFEIERHPEDFLLYFGRLDVYHKGIDTLLEAIARVAVELPSIELRIAGRGPTDRVADLVEKFDIQKNVKVLGAVSDDERNKLFAGAVMQVMPSRFEGFGLAAAEAMAAGVPLIATSVGSLPEVVSPPRGGWLVPASDPDALAKAILKLERDDEARASLSISARESARRFDWDAVADDHYEFLKAIAGGSKE